MSNRALEAAREPRFEIEKALDRKARVYFEKIFSTRHVGRVIDFMLFQAREFLEASGESAAQAEHRLRQVVELAIFNGWTNYRKGDARKCIEIEFGWDKKRLVVVVAFYAENGVGGFLPRAKHKPQNLASARMAKMFAHIQSNSDGLIVRHEQQSGRIETIAFIALDEAEHVKEPILVEVKELQADAAPAADDAGVPQSLSKGELEGFEDGDVAAPAFVAKSKPADDDEGKTQRGPADLGAVKETSTLVASPGGEKIESKILSGKVQSTPKRDETEMRVKGGMASDVDQTVMRVKTLASPGKSNEEMLKISDHAQETVSGDQAKLVLGTGGGPSGTEATGREKELLEQVELLKSEVHALKSGHAATADPTATAFLRDLSSSSAVVEKNSTADDKTDTENGVDDSMPTRREQLLIEQGKVLQEQIHKLRDEKQKLLDALVAEKSRAKSAVVASPSSDAAKQPTIDDDSYSRELKRYQNALDKGEVPDAAQTWARDLMALVLRERAELRNRTKEIDALLRRREHEFKTKEIALGEQVKMLEAQLKQRDMALEKSKETQSSLSETLGKLKAESAGDQGKFELARRLVTTERSLATEKESLDRLQKRADELQRKAVEDAAQRNALLSENTKLKKQVEEAQRRSAQQAQGEESKGPTAELHTLIEQRDKAQRLAEELKRQIRELQTKLAAATPVGKVSQTQVKDGKVLSIQTEVELKHKLEITERLVKNQKEELDRSKKRFDELKTAESKLKLEVNKLHAELAKAQTDLKAAGIRSTKSALAPSAVKDTKTLKKP